MCPKAGLFPATMIANIGHDEVADRLLELLVLVVLDTSNCMLLGKE